MICIIFGCFCKYLTIIDIITTTIKTIAIINNQRFKPLKEREPVHQDIVKLAKMNDVLIITSDIFLKVYEKFRNKQLNSDDIKTMFCNKGLLEI